MCCIYVCKFYICLAFWMNLRNTYFPWYKTQAEHLAFKQAVQLWGKNLFLLILMWHWMFFVQKWMFCMYTRILEVTLFAFAYRLFHGRFSLQSTGLGSVLYVDTGSELSHPFHFITSHDIMNISHVVFIANVRICDLAWIQSCITFHTQQDVQRTLLSKYLRPCQPLTCDGQGHRIDLCAHLNWNYFL